MKISGLITLCQQTFMRKLRRYLKTNVGAFKLRTIRWIVTTVENQCSGFRIVENKVVVVEKIGRNRGSILLTGYPNPSIGSCYDGM